MYNAEQLERLLLDLESDCVERTRATQDRSKIGQAICAFANDLPGRGSVGVLFIGVTRDGGCAGLEITEQLLESVADFASNGTINPLPSMWVRKETLNGCNMLVVEVEPSQNPPVKFEGRVCVRRGPRAGFSTADEDRRLTERRSAFNLPADLQAVTGASLADLDLLAFERELLPSAFAPDVLAENGRSQSDQLKAMRMVSRDGVPTVAGVLTLGKDPRELLPGAYIQFTRYPGAEIDDIVMDQKEITGALAQQLRLVDELLAINISAETVLSGLLEQQMPTYPIIALQELIRNAVIHRNYIGTATPSRVTWFADRVEVTSPGGPFGEVNAGNFGSPAATS